MLSLRFSFSSCILFLLFFGTNGPLTPKICCWAIKPNETVCDRFFSSRHEIQAIKTAKRISKTRSHFFFLSSSSFLFGQSHLSTISLNRYRKQNDNQEYFSIFPPVESYSTALYPFSTLNKKSSHRSILSAAVLDNKFLLSNPFFIHENNMYGLYALITLSSALGIHLEKRSNFGKKLSGKPLMFFFIIFFEIYCEVYSILNMLNKTYW